MCRPKWSALITQCRSQPSLEFTMRLQGIYKEFTQASFAFLPLLYLDDDQVVVHRLLIFTGLTSC